MKVFCAFLLYIVFGSCSAYASQKPYKIRTVAFYNVENLFDTIQTGIRDDDYTPTGKNNWTSKRYSKKIEHLATVIADIGKDVTQTAPDIIGLAEVENKQVLTDLVNHHLLKPENYGIIHFDSKDSRGIDVAMLYKSTRFTPIDFKTIPLKIQDKERFFYSRDILVVKGILDDEVTYFVINHWPSRVGGERRSTPHRNAAAAINRRVFDSIININHTARIIGMGDFNDNPTDPSFKTVLKTLSDKEPITIGNIYNPMEAMYKENLGTLTYRNRWYLFDQIYFTASVLEKSAQHYTYWKSGIYNKRYISTPSGRYAGSPFRTFSGGKYTGGYSDHFPVYIYLVRETKTSQAKF